MLAPLGKGKKTTSGLLTLMGSEHSLTSWCDPYEYSTLIIVSFEVFFNDFYVK